ncbi:MAG: DUF1549 domain-containing protein, partial [Planctomycetales bacterium]|nr:DUF1549 domain-containing protein [Planctomycetales bacterium]
MSHDTIMRVGTSFPTQPGAGEMRLPRCRRIARRLNVRPVPRAAARPTFCLIAVLIALSGNASISRADDVNLWSLNKPSRPAVPDASTLAGGDRVRNPIDAFVFRALEERGLAAAPPADRQTLVRRAYFDLLGLPPTPEQVEAFVSDTSDDAWPRLIDELLASPHYGERWGRHWLDVARYADS